MIISKVGRKSIGVRTLLATITIVLTVGAVTMVYPFLLMVSGSFKSNVDFHHLDVLPAFWFDDDLLFRKHMEAKYNEDQDAAKFNLELADLKSFELLTPPRPVTEARLNDWLEWEAAWVAEQQARLADRRRRKAADANASSLHMPHYWRRHLGAIRSTGNKMVPQNLHLFRRRIQATYDNSLTRVNEALGTHLLSWPTLLLPKITWAERRRTPKWDPMFEAYLEFRESRPVEQFYYTNVTGFFRYGFLKLRYKTIDRYNARHETQYAGFGDVPMPAVRPAPKPPADPKTPRAATPDEPGYVDPAVDWEDFVRRELSLLLIRLRDQTLDTARAVFHKALADKYQPAGRDERKAIERYNMLHETSYKRLADVPLPPRFPIFSSPSVAQARTAVEWQDLLTRQAPAPGHTDARPSYRYLLPVSCLEIDSVDTRFRQHLKEAYKNDLAALNRAYRFAYPDWEAIAPAHAYVRLRAKYDSDLKALNAAAGTRYRRWDDVSDDASVKLLRDAYEGDLDAFNQTIAKPFRTWAQVTPPLYAAELAHFKRRTSDVRHEFTVRNYRMVLDYVLLHGRALFNTVMLVVLTILSQLTVNPLCAYALSRYNLRSTYKILLFCMATMAFPQTVTMIPNFLMLKELGLLNTFAALVLPTMANGYFIFLLKGFFDSLPQEMYESAQIDGAGEFRMFWTFTVACSKPVLAVIALQSFQAAYTQFMFAFITCQDEKMWTIMVWLYQLQQNAPQFVMFAGLCITAIPTLVVFICAQGVIMRGIIVPVEK